MKQNKYDDNAFFDAYSHMSRSVEGLRAAGEWHELKKMLPDFSGKQVLDLGCGYGWHCIYAAEQGATKIIGIDISAKMLAVAKQKTQASGFNNIEYLQVAMEDVDYSDSSFDIVISSLALHYSSNFAAICQKVFALLKEGGEFIFSAEHPIFTASGPQDWCYDNKGQIAHWPVDRYFDESARQTVFLEQTVTKYHRTLTTYINELIQVGFTLQKVVEPMPSAEMLAQVAGMKDELRRPMMLMISAKK